MTEISVTKTELTTSPATAAPADFDMPITGGGLRFLAQNQVLNSQTYTAALTFLGLRPNAKSWVIYWLRILLTAGLLFCVAGIICFFAFNWAAIPHLLKFGIIIALMVICGGITLWRGPDELTGGLSLLACGLLAGPLLAVYGQYYQTGADAWELFRVWTIFLLLLALVGRQNALWLVTWLVGTFWAVLGIYQIYIYSWSSSPLEVLALTPFLLGQLAVLAVWEAAIWLKRKQPGSFLQTAWPARIVACFLLILLTFINMFNIIESDSYRQTMPGSPLVQAIAYIVLLAAGFVWYRRKRPDTLLLTLGMFSLVVQLYAFMLIYIELYNAGGMLFYALLLMGLAFGITRLALHWHHKALQLGLKDPNRNHQHLNAWRQLLFTRAKSLGQLYRHLNLTVNSDNAQLLAGNPAHIELWYIKLLITVCAWIAAIFLIIFMGFIIFEISYNPGGMSFFIFAAIFIALGAFLIRRPQVFVRQFALAVALAGMLSMPASIILWFEMDNFWQLPILFTAVICFIFIKHPAIRAIAFFSIFMSCLDLWLIFYAGTDMISMISGGSIVLFWVKYLISAVIWAVVICIMLNLWLKESRWVLSKTADGYIRPMQTGFIAILLFFGLYSAFFSGFAWHSNLWVWEIYRRSAYLLIASTGAGLGSAVGLIFIMLKLLKNRPDIKKSHKAVIYAGGVICLIAGWWLPWLPVGLLLLALGRYTGNAALAGLSAVFLVICVLWYYYSLNISLLYKAYTLFGVGLVMLIAGLVVYRLFYTQNSMKGAAHA